MIRFMILLIALTISGCSIGPARKMDTCILYMDVREFHCKNQRGTKFNISLDTTKKEDVEYLDRHISAPGEQVIDFMAWIKKAMLELQNTYFSKAR